MIAICEAAFVRLVFFFREIAGIGTQTPHRDTHRVERLSQGTEEHVAVNLREVGLEQELDTLVGIGQHARSPDDEEQQDKQRGHHHLRRLLNTVAHPVFYNQMGHQQDDHRPEHRLHRVGRHLHKVRLEIFRVALQMTRQ